MLVLCDGMGGHQAGEIASQFVTYELQKRFEEENLIEINRAESWLRSNIKEINFQLYNYAQKKMKITEVWVQRSFVPSFMTNKLL